MASGLGKLLVAAFCALACFCTGVDSASYGVRNKKVILQILAQQNRVRHKYGAKSLTWSKTLARSAQQWTNQCNFSHDVRTLQAKGYGENLTLGTSRWQQAVQLWLNEAPNYSFKAATWAADTGHFTQVVWKGTRHVGCAVTHCGIGNLWSCRYFPAGNWLGQFSKNVG